MTTTQFSWLVVGIVFWFYAQEVYELLILATIRVRFFFMNLRLRLLAYWIYLKLKREMKALNLPVPKFTFIPIQDRTNG